MRADFVDYIIADDVVIPLGDEDQYTESVIRLPGCFLPASDFPADEPPGRGDLGLPEHATVFCSFNHSYKIEPDTFTAWMRILEEIPDSVLWIYTGANNLAEKNLLSAAESSGVDPERLVFAPRLPLGEHLARLPVADIFLDTIYYNAGATAIATIQAGVPILTLQSGRILGRMGASINRALGLDELTCSSIDEYVAKAIELAKNPDQVRGLKKRIDDARPALFDLQRFAKKLETAFEKTLDGLPR
jgi:predicted O-linked N-acetylglucosamine transferase (SPINDLY family)